MRHIDSPSPPENQATASPSRAQRLHWPLILLLGAVALTRPLLHITGVIGGPVPSGPLPVLAVTAAITAVWVAAVLLAGVERPFVTVILAALSYALMSMILSAILSPILLGEFQGPLANPLAIGPMLITNALWGAIAGGIALGLRRMGVRR
ncbi:hypothetical protein [Pseudactinotalea sp. Z1732]|uniref:hypothetical protein n=1 Tax=Micrococcales TaxID=85006 RepID=UPI003C7E43A3